MRYSFGVCTEKVQGIDENIKSVGVRMEIPTKNLTLKVIEITTSLKVLCTEFENDLSCTFPPCTSI